MLERRPTSLRFLFLGFAALSLLASSCNEDPSTQVVVLMDTDYLVPTDVDRIQARILKVSDDGVGETETWSQVFLLSSEEEPGPGLYSLPASFGVVPAEGDMDRGIVIEVEALLGSADEPLVQRRVRTGFIQGKFLVVRMLLYRACTDMICAEGESCGCEDAAACLAPFCVDEFVDPKNLEVTDNPGVLPPNPEIPTDPDVSDCEPLTLCGTECVDTDTDPLFCGNCTTACSSGEVCVEGACIEPGDCRTNGIDCSGFTYCDEVTGTCLRGCEANEQCGSSETCDTETHECVCMEGFDRCLDRCVDTQTDPLFCGDCMTFCGSREVCQAGMCADLGDCRTNGIGCAGLTYCDLRTGECLPGCVQDDQCGAANEVCDTDINDCVCDTGFESCPPIAGACVDTQTDPLFCGDCGTACGSGEVCQAGACFDPSDCRTNGIGCSGFTYCDPSTGVCTSGCDDNAQCTRANEICDVLSHACVCGSGFEPCPPIFGFCVDTQTDVRYCGNCQTACGTGEVCQLGACFDPNDCRTNGIGCSGLTYCDPSTGDCLPGCANDAQCAGANEICDVPSHVCVCGSGFERCPPFFGLCVDTQTDTANCGDCGTTCGSGEFCFGGECFGFGF